MPTHQGFELSVLDEEVDFESCSGREITVTDSYPKFGRFLSKHLSGSYFQSSINVRVSKSKWGPLAVNKFGKTVAAFRLGDDGSPKLLLLPQLAAPDEFLQEILSSWCQIWQPSLFPDSTQNVWLSDDRYQHPQITELESKQAEIRRQAAAELSEVESAIAKSRAENQDWSTFLSGTDDELVQAVIRTLQKFGFTDVIDVDEEAKAAGCELREDIRIEDREPILVIDVKGVNGKPEDSEATQAEKHMLMRMRDVDRKCKALTIINSERNLPPHERYQQAYRDEIVKNAEQTGLGLMTTLDLYWIMRNAERLNWPEHCLWPIFYRDGRIDGIPSHYAFIGQIEKVWPDASSFGVVPNVEVPTGERIAVEIDHQFHEVSTYSLQEDGKPVTSVGSGGNCGIACDLLPAGIREKQRVFLLITDWQPDEATT